MRTICIAFTLLILSGLSYSQSKKVEVEPEGHGRSDTSTIRLSLYFDDNGCKIENALTLTDLLDLWVQYSAECWADSGCWLVKSGIKHPQYTYYEYGGMYYREKISCRCSNYFVTHREPTFTGFMEFLKSRVKCL